MTNEQNKAKDITVEEVIELLEKREPKTDIWRLLFKKFDIPSNTVTYLLTFLQVMEVIDSDDNDYKLLIKSANEIKPENAKWLRGLKLISQWDYEQPSPKFFKIYSAAQNELRKRYVRTYYKSLKKPTVNDKKIIYDLSVTKEAEAANDFIRLLARYCKEVRHKRIDELFNSDTETIKASEILRALSGKGVRDYDSCADFDLFHSHITKVMLSGGWFIEFPALLLDTKGIALLRMDIIKYILTNWDWLTAVYSPNCFLELANCYGTVSLKVSAIEEEALRLAYVKKTLMFESDNIRETINERAEMFVAKSERNKFFDNHEDEKIGNIKNVLPSNEYGKYDDTLLAG